MIRHTGGTASARFRPDRVPLLRLRIGNRDADNADLLAAAPISLTSGTLISPLMRALFPELYKTRYIKVMPCARALRLVLQALDEA